MANDPVPANAPPWAGYVNPFDSWWQELPEACGRPVAQRRSLAARKDGGHPAATAADPTRADEVHPEMHFVQMPALQPGRYGISAHSQISKLSACHDAILVPSQSLHGSIRHASGRSDVHSPFD